MSAGCVRWLLSHTVRTTCRGCSVYWTPTSRSPICSGGRNVVPATWGRSPFSSEGDNVEQTPTAKKRNPRAHDSIGSVGRKIPHKEIQVIGEAGEDLGVMHRGNVIRLMDEKNLKLVLLNKTKDPPVYQLMSGKQIHEEQMKLKDKVKPAPVQLKELNFLVGIAPHDLLTKLKQAESWLEKKHHVKITLKAKRNEPVVDLDGALEKMVEQMNVLVGFVSKPSMLKEGRVAVCVLRPPSKKELSQKGARKSVSPAEENQKKTPPAGDTVSSEESVQQ